MKKISLFLILILIFTLCSSIFASAYSLPEEPHSEAVLLVYSDKDTIVYEKNANKKLFPASLTKIMTAVIVLEKIKDLDTVKITAKESVLRLLDGTDSSHADIVTGETLTMRQLLYCLLVQSANDAAVIIADYLGEGDINKFIKMMNDKAKQLNCTTTNFMNPHGLHDTEHYTTANDMYKITKYAMTLPAFSEICATTRYTIPETTKNDERTLVTTNYLLDRVNGGDYYYEYAKGIKTGYTDESGRCLVSNATKDGYNYLLITMGAFDDDDNYSFIDAIDIYEWVFSTLKLKTIIDEKTPTGEVKVDLSWDKEFVTVIPKQSFTALIPAQVDATSIIVELTLPDSIPAPVKAGDKLGTAKLYLADEFLGEIDLIASESIEQSKILAFLNSLNSIISSSLAKIFICILIFLIVAYIIFNIIINRSKKKKTYKKVKDFRKF